MEDRITDEPPGREPWERPGGFRRDCEPPSSGGVMPENHVPLTKEEVGIVLGVRLMYWGVPFHRITKRALSHEEDAAGDAVWERLLALRDAARTSESSGGHENDDPPFVFLPLTEEERRLYVEMTQACLAECGDDEIELRIQLGTSNREALEQVLEKVRRVE
jgi:hypothetical protein